MPKTDNRVREDDHIKKEKKSNARQDDRLWKAVLEHVFRHFLLFFFPRSGELFDFKKGFVYLDKELDELFPQNKGGKGVRYVDKLVKVYLKDGGEKFILAHIEVQSQKGKGDLARRMYNYFIRIREKHKVPITAIAILADGNKAYRPGIYAEEYLGTKLSYEFTTYKIIDQDEEALRKNPNPFAVVVLTALLAIKRKNANDDDLKAIKHDLYREMKARNMPKITRKGIYDFLTYYVSFVNPEMLVIFESELSQLEGRSTTVGTTEYLLDKRTNEVEEKNKTEFVTNLILNTDFGDRKIASLAVVSVSFVRKIQAALNKKSS